MSLALPGVARIVEILRKITFLTKTKGSYLRLRARTQIIDVRRFEAERFFTTVRCIIKGATGKRSTRFGGPTVNRKTFRI